MAGGQNGNKRQIGKGMKPQGNKRIKSQKKTSVMIEQSTNEGQEDPTLEPVLDPQEGNSKGGNLEPENGQNLLQNLENAQSDVAQMVALDGDLEAATYSAPRSRSQWPLMPEPLPR